MFDEDRNKTSRKSLVPPPSPKGESRTPWLALAPRPNGLLFGGKTGSEPWNPLPPASWFVEALSLPPS